MFITLFNKEILESITSKRFIVVLVLCTVIMPLSSYVMYKDYQSRFQDYTNAVQIYEADNQFVKDVLFKDGGKALRRPSNLSFLSLGLELFLPTIAEVKNKYGESFGQLRYQNLAGQDHLYDHYYGPMDMTFLVSVVMAFFSFVFTYGAIAREKELGTLKQILSNPVPRHQLILAKLTANFLLLIIPLLMAVLISLLILQAMGLLFFGTPGDSNAIILALLFSGLFIGVFFNLGILVSSLAKRSQNAIVTLLLCWVFLYGIYPRVGVLLAGILVPVENQQKIDTEKEQLKWNLENEMDAEINRHLMDSRVLRDSKQYQVYMEQQQAIRDQYKSRLLEEYYKIDEDLNAKSKRQTALALNLSRLSPVGCFVRPMAEIAGTGIRNYRIFQEDTRSYLTLLNMEIFANVSHTRTIGGIGTSYNEKNIEEAAPRFQPSNPRLREIMTDVLPDMIILILYNGLFFAAAFISSLRYDPR